MIILRSAALFLLAHVAVALVGAPALWGIDPLLYLPMWVAGAVAAVGLALLIPAWQRALGRSGAPANLLLDFWATGRRAWASRLTLTALLGAVFVLASARTALLGDGLTYLRQLPYSLARGVAQVEHEPLAFAAVRAVHGLVAFLHPMPALTYRIYSVLCGIVFVLLCFPAAAALHGERRARLFALGLLLTAGYAQFFCGYVETYAIVMPALLLYLLSGLLALRGRIAPWLPALALGASLPLHFSLCALLPSLAVIGWIAARRPAAGAAGGRPAAKRPAPARETAARAAAAAAMLLGAALAATGVLLLLGMEPTTFFSRLRGDHLLPLVSAPSFRQAYRLISWPHLVDLLNEGLLVAPAAGLALVGLRRPLPWRSPAALFLACAAAFPLLFVVLVNPEIGAFRDWDLLALPALPVLLWSALMFAGEGGARKDLGAAGIVIVAAAAIHASLWVGVNASRPAAEARFARCLETCRLSRHGSAYGWETLGNWHMQRPGEAAAALQAYEQAIRADDRNPRYWDLAGMMRAATGETVGAIRYLEKSVAIQPESHPENYNNLGGFYFNSGRPDLALRSFRKAAELAPGYASAWSNLGMACRRLKRYDEALAAYGRLTTLEPDSAGAFVEAAAASQEAQRPAEAIPLLQRALALRPRLIAARMLLGECQLETARYQEALDTWRGALSLRPGDPDLELRIASAYEALGQRARSLEVLHGFLREHPDHQVAAQVREQVQALEGGPPAPRPSR